MSFGTNLIFAAIFLPLLCAPLVTLLGRHAAVRDALTSGAALVAFVASTLLLVLPAQAEIAGFCLLGARFSAGGYRGVLLVMASAAFLLSSLAAPSYFAGEPRTARYQTFFLVTLGGVMGVFLASDLFTVYLFFECMSLSSWVWVAHNETEQARDAAKLYLVIAIIGGLSMLYGLIDLYALLGSLSFETLQNASVAVTPRMFVDAICILAGFGAKAGMFPLHIWLPKAHPAAPAPASALLSGVLTKAGILGALVLSTGLMRGNASFSTLLLVLGLITMVLGAILALLASDLKRALACSSLSQIGFILVSVSFVALAAAPQLAAGGALLHMLNHSLVKTVLFLAAGVLYKTRHTLELNRLRGAGHGNGLLAACFLIGALSLAGVPLMTGYASKTMMHEGITANIAVAAGCFQTFYRFVEIAFLLTGGLTFAYMTKLFICLFLQRGDEECEKKPKMDLKTSVAVALPALALLLCGLLPGRTLSAIVAYAAPSLGVETERVAFFSLESLKGAAISLGAGLAFYLLLVRGLLTRKDGSYRVFAEGFSLEKHVYRPLLNALVFIGTLVARVAYSIPAWLVLLMTYLTRFGARPRVHPGRDDHFAHYSKKYVRADPLTQTLDYELLLFGLGVAAILVYLLVG